MKRIFLSGLLSFVICIFAFCDAIAQNSDTTLKTFEYHLWPSGAPSSNNITAKEEANPMFVINVTDPVLTVYVPKNPNGLAVLACPGGSYCQVWQGTEGHNMASWYNEQGVVYAVLKYRLPNGGHFEVPLDDVHRAMAIMKENKKDYPFEKIGIQGCSAGGHLASTAATHYTKDNRPDFQILFYPVISFDLSFTHMATRESLIGKNASQDLVKLYSNELQITQDTPPAIIFASTNDGLVPVRNSVEYYNSLIKNGVSAAMCLYPSGDHGWFGNTNFEYRNAWQNTLKVWLNGLLK